MNNAGLSSKASTRQIFTKAIMPLSEIRCIEFLVYRLALYEIKRHKAAYHCRVRGAGVEFTHVRLIVFAKPIPCSA
jgi:hypothetical protein